jgi:uncharacterized membrane protein (DUF485 family)
MFRKWRKNMKRFVLVSLLFFFLVAFIVPVYASVTEVLVNDSVEDKLINSPILVLGGMIIVIVIAFVYRKVRK